jgi:hypothetical protein
MASAWSKDLKITATINKALVAQYIAAETPVGDHSHDDKDVAYGAKSQKGSRVRRSYKGVMKGGWPRESGRLQKFFGHVPNWHLSNRGQDCYINVFLPYVRALNFGADIPAVKFSNWKMHWSDGSPVFRSGRKGYHITARHFIERGVQVFASHGGNAIHVEWAKGTDTA